MKKLILLTVCCLFTSLYAVKVYAGEPYELKKEFTVRLGVVDGFDNDYWDWDWYYYDTPLERYEKGRYYYDDKIFTEAITLSYSHELKRWLALGINVTYSGVFQKQRRRSDDQVVNEYKRHRLALYPMVKFTYFNRPIIRLYSAAGFGFGVEDERWTSDRSSHERETLLVGQLTLFGVSVGKKLFASWEVGAGSAGYITMCAGYRF